MKYLLPALLIVLSSVPFSEAESPHQIVIVEDEFAHKATTDLDGCRASLERPKNHVNYVHFRNDCPQALEEKLAVVEIHARDG